MTQDNLTTPEIPSGSHPSVCPRCDRRAGVYDIATGISECALCEMQWRGPRVMLVDPKDLQTPDGVAEVVRQVQAGLDGTKDADAS